jgi:hypothetical protein
MNNNNNNNIITDSEMLKVELREYSIEELYASWIRNVLIIVVSTLAIFSMLNNCDGDCKRNHKFVIILLLLSSLIMLISSTIDYNTRMKSLYKNMHKNKSYVYVTMLPCTIIWILLIFFIIVVRLKN